MRRVPVSQPVGLKQISLLKAGPPFAKKRAALRSQCAQCGAVITLEDRGKLSLSFHFL
jgi:hypothetical protein